MVFNFSWFKLQNMWFNHLINLVQKQLQSIKFYLVSSLVLNPFNTVIMKE
jgi:hypothetical protein